MLITAGAEHLVPSSSDGGETSLERYISKRSIVNTVYLSRTIFISDVAPSMNAVALRELLELHARIETVRLNTGKGQAFVKIATRQEAEQVKQILTGYRIGKHMFKIGWGCGYGPREHFNYTEGFTMFPIEFSLCL